MDVYELGVRKELKAWQEEMARKPTLLNAWSKKMQVKINRLIPEKVHQSITAVLKQMIRGVLFGAGGTTGEPVQGIDLEQREKMVLKKIDKFRETASIEGGITGAGGLLLGLADFPVLIAIKIKLLFEIAALYGFDTKDYKERIYLLHIFELAFSSHEHRQNVFMKMTGWEEKTRELPASINDFEWRSFQQEYRDYIDLAKMAQLIPGIGAPVGFIVNNRLLTKLGRTAMNAYRMRVLGGG